LILIGVFLLFASSSTLAYLEKLLVYECDFDLLDDAKSHFDIQFYLVSILFIIFDWKSPFYFLGQFFLTRLVCLNFGL